MINIILFVVVVICSLATIFGGNIHGYIGAAVLGLNGVLFDLFWQWLRYRIVRKNKTGYLVGGIFGGLLARVASVFLFILLGRYWLGYGSNYFLVFAACLLTIPLWNIIAAYKFKLERN